MTVPGDYLLERPSEESSSPDPDRNIREQIIRQVDAVFCILDAEYPQKLGFLSYRNPFELLIAVILSAQTTDRQVNEVTGTLFTQFPDPYALAAADIAAVEAIIRSTGYYRAKAKHIISAASALLHQYSGTVPGSMEELLQIPGIGRKSASVILGAIFKQPAIIVDTHFSRVVQRLGLTGKQSPEKIEHDIAAILTPDRQYRFSMLINYHGREFCSARKPLCGVCPICDHCRKKGISCL